ncbi:hypothetical protein Tsubulata_006365 [Turnera subulata]|uniref:Terpene synthase N-terminal domain-containing protein n=1 Tax=Turnera subulata TaxID=218843 RepID=A0A9Q0EZ09_9ROSI|nr:hypothetical protein Tsubulata_006365 [Turnera subulata]
MDFVDLVWPHRIIGDDKEEEVLEVSTPNDEIPKYVTTIRSILSSMEDGEINLSPYDTAWVALLEDVNRTDNPQFPSSIRWIADNQLSDGSWGDPDVCFVHDRLLNTLACVVALKKWNVYPDKCEKGMSFFNDNICKLEDENAENIPCGFEIVFPSLLDKARMLEIEIPNDSGLLQRIYAMRNLKLTKIPKEIMHAVPTSLLYSLEGLRDHDWERLLKLQFQDGSFLFSPSSTAFAFMQTKDDKCMQYLSKTVQKFGGAVPSAYPMDIFEQIWAVDRLQRLGISRYFQPEIEERVSYIHSCWSSTEGLGWAKNSRVHDLDDTAMGFRQLRLHGYDVSPDVIERFRKGDEFVSYPGESNNSLIAVCNFYRTTQLLFPGEKTLKDGKEFAYKYLRERQAANDLLDKWLISKDLPGEVRFALDVPWYACLPRLESRFYIEQYGGQEVVWIAKTFIRMPYIDNNNYLELAKLDYNNCQALHRREWNIFQKWYQEWHPQDFGLSSKSLLLAYFLAAASIFETERSRERLAWAKTAVMLDTIENYFVGDCSIEERRAFVHEFTNGLGAPLPVNGRRLDTKNRRRQELVTMLHGTIDQISFNELVAHGRDIGGNLRSSWEKWLLMWEGEGDRHKGEAELLVKTILLSAGPRVSVKNLIDHPQFEQLTKLTNKICYQLAHFKNGKVSSNE